MKSKYKHVKFQMFLGKRWCNSFLVTYPISYNYNGMPINGKWYNGYRVAKPKIPKGFTLKSIGCGLQFNAHPPYATSYLKPIDNRKITKTEAKEIIKQINQNTNNQK